MDDTWTWPKGDLTVSLYTNDPDSFTHDVREMSRADGTAPPPIKLHFKMASVEDVTWAW